MGSKPTQAQCNFSSEELHWVSHGVVGGKELNITHFFFQSLILTIQVLFTEHISFRVMCRERAWLFKSGVVFVQRKGMVFKVRHGLRIQNRHDLLTQA